MSDVDLGFPEKRPTAWLTNRYFPSKVGGKPAWLELNVLPSQEQLRCAKCRRPKTFLCQIYAPFDNDDSFHRSIYVFVCRAAECQIPNVADNISVFRSQLPMKNDFYSEDPPAEDGQPLPEIPPRNKLCVACGCLSTQTCGRCHKANYCSVEHQRAHWPQHKPNCGVKTDDVQKAEPIHSPLTEVVFPEYEIAMEPSEFITSLDHDDDVDEEYEEDAKEKIRLKEFKDLSAAGKAGSLQDVPDDHLQQYAATSEMRDDKYFGQFKEIIDKDPEQILRYHRHGSPLWIADVQQTHGVTAEKLTIPKCEACGGDRQFEFQIMPQMLNQLKDENLDWGVLVIYTCAKSCRPPADGNGYLREFILKQDIVHEMKDD